MQLMIEIDSAHIEESTRGEYSFREQKGYAHVLGPDGKPGRYPKEIRISLEKAQEAYPKGSYILSPASVYVDKYGKLAIGRLKLLAAPAVEFPARPVAAGTGRSPG